jgi:tetratricopeptide (TPR) repeat protein
MKKTAVVTSDDQLGPSHKKRKVIFDIAVIAVVALIIGAVWWFGHRPKPEPQPTVPQYSHQDLVKEVTKKYGNNDYLGAIRLIQGQKKINDTETQVLLASAYSTSGDHKKGLEVYRKLDREGKLAKTDLANVAAVAEQAKDYPAAIEYYKRAKEALKGSDANSDQAAVYDYQIAELEKKK